MSLFKNSLNKTIVSSLSVAITDARTKIGVVKQAVSAKIDATVPFTNLDVAVTDTNTYSISTITTILVVACAEPIFVVYTDNNGNTMTHDVKGLLFLNGSYEGTITLVGKTVEQVRCTVVFA